MTILVHNYMKTFTLNCFCTIVL
uniref:Uncharacterized protein n=1 Tax=Anguilla anguilla TaxID=7936 RepID=A0A0E9UAU9_ANGAN